jgi:hypothetical protein
LRTSATATTRCLQARQQLLHGRVHARPSTTAAASPDQAGQPWLLHGGRTSAAGSRQQLLQRRLR